MPSGSPDEDDEDDAQGIKAGFIGLAIAAVGVAMFLI